MPDVPGQFRAPDDESFGPAIKAVVLAALSFFLVVGSAVVFDRTTSSNFYPGTKIGGVTVGSRTADAVEAILHERFVMPLRQPMKLHAEDFESNVSPWKMGMRLEVSNAVRDAMVTQRAQAFSSRVWHRIFGDEADLKLEPTVDKKIFGAFLKKTFKEVNQKPEDARLDVSSDQLKVIPHKVGRSVDRKKAEKLIFSALTERKLEVEIPVKIEQPALTTASFKNVIHISTGSNRLLLYKNGKVHKKYRVATGTGGYPTPHGQFLIVAKRYNPTWYNPNSDWSRGMPAFIPPGPNNPLGTRALNLSASGIRIHGTPDAGSIGTNASHGCIRMLMHDAEDLFERVEVGTPVLVVY